MNNVTSGWNEIALRMLETPADLPLLKRWLNSPHVYRWWGPQARNIATLAQRSRTTDAIITADGRPVGYLCWERLSPSELEGAGLTDLPENLVAVFSMAMVAVAGSLVGGVLGPGSSQPDE